MLDDVEPAVFNVFVDWLYTQKLPPNWSEWKHVMAEKQGDSLTMRNWLLKVYAFADRFVIPTLRTHANRAIIANCDYYTLANLPCCMETAFAFEHLPANDPILDLFVDLYCVYWNFGYTVEDYGLNNKFWFLQLPKELLVRYMIRTGKIRECNDLAIESKIKLHCCSYHDHKSEEEQNRCQEKMYESGQEVWVKREENVFEEEI